MFSDKFKPLYSLTIGEYISLTTEIVEGILSGQNKPSLASLDEEHFNIRDCAKFLRCSLVSIHKYKKQGLPFYRIGRKVLFKKTEVLDFMKKTGKKISSIMKKE